MSLQRGGPRSSESHSSSLGSRASDGHPHLRYFSLNSHLSRLSRRRIRMTTALWIWSAYHAIAVIGQMFTRKPNASAGLALVLISWMAGAAMVWSDHIGWFLWSNIPVIAVVALAGLSHLGKPPGPDNEEKATEMLWASVIRLSAVLATWATHTTRI